MKLCAFSAGSKALRAGLYNGDAKTIVLCVAYNFHEREPSLLPFLLPLLLPKLKIIIIWDKVNKNLQYFTMQMTFGKIFACFSHVYFA